MAVQQTLFAPRDRIETTIRQGEDVTLEWPLESRGALAVVTSGICTVYNASGVVVKTGAVDVTTPTVPHFDLLAADTASQIVGSGWRVEWTNFFMPDGKSYDWTTPAHLVLWAYYSTVSDDDVDGRGRYPNLVKQRPTIAGLKTWENQRAAASEYIQRRLLKDLRRPWLIRQPLGLHDAEIELVYALIFEGLGMGADVMSGQNWPQLAKDHRQAYERAWNQAQFDYASPTSTTGGTERVAAQPVQALCATGYPRS